MLELLRDYDYIRMPSCDDFISASDEFLLETEYFKESPYWLNTALV